ncbi:MAG TPA: prephenate dehydrogenase/arogenate dehydrogenase family protein [Burkholderiaceae bacterium]|nr:prephenate dehydrogenase/arogenate dehydrogenase family protein [Burkholderiaceae bacterium]
MQVQGDQSSAGATAKPMRLALLGVGMMGGSAAQAWRAAGQVSQVVGFDVDGAALQTALAGGVIDEAAPSAAQAVAAADVVLLAVPVGAMAEVLAHIAPTLPAQVLITDLGSTKASVIAAAREHLSAQQLVHFVPAHPIAGAERSGVAAADAALFAQRWVILTPQPGVDAQAVLRIEQIWRACGARIERMSADEHDQMFAAVSHLPHLLAYALMACIGEQAQGQRALQFAGAGFRDFTRIAASSPPMWRDIALANQAALSAQLARYREILARMQAQLDAGNGVQLHALFEQASQLRGQLAGVGHER